MEHIPNTAYATINLRLDSPGTRVKTNNIDPKKYHNKMTPDDIPLSSEVGALYSHHQSSYLSDRNKFREPQSSNMQRVKDLGLLSPNWRTPSNPLLRVLGNMEKRRQKKYESTGMEDTKRVGILNQHEQRSCGFMETEAACRACA